MEALAYQILDAEGFEIVRTSEHASWRGTSRYITADRLVRERVTVRVSDHKSSQLGRRVFSIVWKRPNRVWQLRKWLSNLRLDTSCKTVTPRTPVASPDHSGLVHAGKSREGEKKLGAVAAMPPHSNTGGKKPKAPYKPPK